ncbi:hypothetical protein ACOSQ2_024158 [Xanthoceras sorbifolium]
MVSIKKLAKKVKVMGGSESGSGSKKSQEHECLLIDELERFVAATGFLSQQLFKILLEKSYNEFGFEGLTEVSVFQEIVNIVKSSNRRFDV